MEGVRLDQQIINALVWILTFLMASIAFFLSRTFSHLDQAIRKQIELATEVKVLIANFQNQTAALKRHEEINQKEHERIREEIEMLGQRDHELANQLASLWGTAQQFHGWDLPDQKPITRRPKKIA